ncbi:MAG TPA: ATP-binding cassette domain-containing protein [Gemmatimonadales bacterium]|nr:ATP-binding cassette domain-containing protein [Gemmatimonadales bacterium]
MTAAPLVFENVPLSARERAPFTLSVAPHQTVAVLGDEDSGVDRLGGYAMALERPRAGRVRTFDTDVESLPERERLAFRRRVGYLPAGDGLLQNLSLRDNVALPLRFGSDATPYDIDGRVNVILVAVRLGGAADRRPARANEEECRRAALGRAIAFDPLLLVLEQPFDGITARASAELLEIARGGETAEGARRSLLITGQEIPSVVQRRCDKVYRLTRAGTLELETA